MEDNNNNNMNTAEVQKIINLNDDDYLIKKFNEGDVNIFRNLVHKHKEKVRSIIYLTVGNSSYVDDIAQDVFITVYKNLNKFRFQSQFTTWLYRITVNKCKDHLRKVKIKSFFLIEDAVKEHEPSYRQNESVDISEIVNKNILKLPEKLRTPLLLKEIEGFSYQEIAEAVNCEVGTVKSRIFRAREQMKKLLKPYEKELMI